MKEPKMCIRIFQKKTQKTIMTYSYQYLLYMKNLILPMIGMNFCGDKGNKCNLPIRNTRTNQKQNPHLNG